MFIFRFPHRISMGHRLCGDSSPKCQTPHGHNEIITLELSSAEDCLDGDENMAAEFGAMKGQWKRFLDEFLDHAFQMNENDPLRPVFEQNKFKLVLFPGDPTTEMLAGCLFSKARYFMQALPTLTIRSITVEETPSNIVELTFGAIPAILLKKRGWWSDPYTTRGAPV